MTCKSVSRSVTSAPKTVRQPYHLSNGGDGVFLADAIDIVPDPGIGPDEERHNSDTDTDLNFGGGASFEYSQDRDRLECRDVDGSTDVS